MNENGVTTEKDGDSTWQGDSNPFPHAAVARVYDPRPGVLTIETPAVREADRLVSSYLSVTRAPTGGGESDDHLIGKGKVCVIEGDYGAGKTHLAMELLARAEAARANSGTDMRVFYQVVPGGTFLSLYTGFMKDHIGPTEMLARVRELYADIVAEALRDRPFTDTLIGDLLRDDVDPQLVIDGYGLKEGALRDQLRKRLSTVTGDEMFSRALMLLLQKDLRPLAWDWLVGGFPHAVLTEQGVTRPIATDIQAMDALGVLARLYGRGDRRFVLVIDEMEKLAQAWDSRDVTRAQAFKKLLEVFHLTGALLVMCGLPDIFEILPRDPGRVDQVIHPSPLTVGDVSWYIRQAQQHAFARDVLAPFTRESVDYVVYLTGGVARDVLRICYYAFAEAAETGEEVTPATIRQVARYRVPNGGIERVRSDAAEILTEQGWHADRHRVLGSLPGVVADFWIPLDEADTGCAVLISESVLEDDETRRLTERVATVISGGAERALILVVGGYLPAGQQQVLADALGGQSLVVYHAQTFGKEFAQALAVAMERAGGTRSDARRAGPASDEFRVLRAETERIARQQASTLRAVQELLQQSDALADAVTELHRPSAATREAGPGLPAELETMFSRARQSLDAYGDVRRFLDKTFEITARQPGERYSLTRQLRTADAFTPIGIAAYLSDLLGSFRASVQSWLASVRDVPGGDSLPPPGQRERLHEICQTYDALYGVAQVYKLDPLPERISFADSEEEASVRPSRSARREALEAAFGALGDRVYQAALQAANAGQGEES